TRQNLLKKTCRLWKNSPKDAIGPKPKAERAEAESSAHEHSSCYFDRSFSTISLQGMRTEEFHTSIKMLANAELPFARTRSNIGRRSRRKLMRLRLAECLRFAGCVLLCANVCLPVTDAQAQEHAAEVQRKNIAYFVDEAQKAGLNAP